MADQAFSRAAGAPLVTATRVRLLEDARENYPAWLDAIARRASSDPLRDATSSTTTRSGGASPTRSPSAARAGVRVRVLYDWLGGFGKTSRALLAAAARRRRRGALLQSAAA